VNWADLGNSVESLERPPSTNVMEVGSYPLPLTFCGFRLPQGEHCSHVIGEMRCKADAGPCGDAGH
jgi:hypothetical protein